MIHSAASAPVIFDQDGMLGHSLATFGNVEYIQLSLPPGATLPKHALPFAIEFFVISGTGMALLADREVEVTARQLIRVEAGEPRGWRNTGEEELILLGIKHIAVE